MRSTLKKVSCLTASVLCWAYLAVLFGWLALHLLISDRFIYLALLNYLAVYLFYPLPVVLGVAWLCRRVSLWVGFAIGALAFAWFWGGLYLPRLYVPATSGPALTVMTYNVLAWHRYTEPIIATIHAEDPDIVLLQELNTDLAETLGRELGQAYPYQVLEPADNPTGIGVISKHPIQLTGERLPLRWIGGPQVLELQWNGRRVTLVNFHLVPTTGISPRDQVEDSLRLRESQARLLADLAGRSGLAILGGDANTSPRMAAYRILADQLGDAWQEAGFGLGHTFPGSAIPESDRPKIGNYYVPQWLARIDYVFHSDEWVTISARTAQIDGVSDHRGVVAMLKLRR